MTINKSSAFIRLILVAGALAVSLLAAPVGAASPREMPDDNINLNFLEWLAKGEVTHWAQICICKAYSREIEYNEDNTEQLAAFSVLDEME